MFESLSGAMALGATNALIKEIETQLKCNNLMDSSNTLYPLVELLGGDKDLVARYLNESDNPMGGVLTYVNALTLRKFLEVK